MNEKFAQRASSKARNVKSATGMPVSIYEIVYFFILL